MLRQGTRHLPKLIAVKSSSALSGLVKVNRPQPSPADKLFEDIHRALDNDPKDSGISRVASTYFDGQGKAVRPKVALTMAEAVNHHLGLGQVEPLRHKQRVVAQVSEMYHSASLMHDDVLDNADLRRGKISMNRAFGNRNSIFAGTFTMVKANELMASQLESPEATKDMMTILSTLVNGELQQMTASFKSSDRLSRYIEKSYNKTASLIALSCQAVTRLALEQHPSNHPKASSEQDKLLKNSFSFGKNLGIAFQLVDDLLDFTSEAELLGKKAGVDMKLGIATAPVIFASESNEELKQMIRRQFSGWNDTRKALEMVLQSDGMEKTKLLSQYYSEAAITALADLKEGRAKSELVEMASSLMSRNR